MPKPNPVVAGKIGGCLCWHDDIVGGEGVLGTRKAHFPDFRTEFPKLRDRLVDLPSHSGIDPIDEVLFRHTDPYPFEISAVPDGWIYG